MVKHSHIFVIKHGNTFFEVNAHQVERVYEYIDLFWGPSMLYNNRGPSFPLALICYLLMQAPFPTD